MAVRLLVARSRIMRVAPVSVAIGYLLQPALAFATFHRPLSSYSRGGASETSLAMSKKEAFSSWTFDKPCTSMEWNELVPASLTVLTRASVDTLAGADLVMVGVVAPAKEESDDDDEEEEKETPVTLTGVAAELDASLEGALTELLAENSKAFKNGAKAGSTTPTLRMAKSARYIALGIGTEPKPDAEDKFVGAGTALGKAVADKCNTEKKVKSCKVVLPEAIAGDEAQMKDFAAAFYQTLYADNRFKTGAKVKKVAEDLESVEIWSEGATADAAALHAGKRLAAGIFLTKDIVNAPHNVLNSLSLADTAKKIAAESKGRLQCTILGKKECEKRGMGAYLGTY